MSATLPEQLVTANRIVANEGIISGFGHVSVRDPESDTMYISRSLSPALVTEDDIVEVTLDGEVLDDRRTYKENVIHRAIYKQRDDVDAVIHHHAPAVLPFAVSDTEMRPAFHMGALVAEGVPKFTEYDEEYGWLVVTEAEGERMAQNLGDRRAQLLEGHGANVTGSSIKEAVLATVYFVMNARYQLNSTELGDQTFAMDNEAMIESMIHDVILSDIAVDRMWTYLTSRLPDE